jgi:hypothetical protein
MQKERAPDLIAHKPVDVWVLGPHEEPPQGAVVTTSLTGIRLAFRPVKGERNEQGTAASTEYIQ